MTQSILTVLNIASSAFGYELHLYHRSAGAMMTPHGEKVTREHWGVVTIKQGRKISAKTFLNDKEAQECFAQYTTPIIEKRA